MTLPSQSSVADPRPPFTIAIDGPAAAGKGTLARYLAAHFTLPLLDTGLLYRATARKATLNDLDPAVAARSLDASDLDRDDLRMPEISQDASRISALPEVRTALIEMQRRFARQPGGAVLDGRDIGTVICPEADVKLFITASTEVRARRRYAELAASGASDTHADVLEEMRQRDARDSGRDTAPLRPAEDAHVLDTSDMTPGDVATIARRLVLEAAAGRTVSA